MMSSNHNISSDLLKLDLIPIKHTDVKNDLSADFIELSALFSSDEISLNDVLQSYKTNEVTINKVIKIEDEFGIVTYEEDDNEELWIKEIFQICLYRNEELDINYPFHLTSGTIILKDELNEKQKIYLSLLLSSNLNYFPFFKTDLTTDFEQISYQSLKTFLPNKAKVKQFGKNSDYIGTAKSKIIALAKDMHIKTEDDIINADVRGNQEKGLDVVAWIPFSDKVPNFVSIFAQCACGKEWYKKKGETKRYLNYFKFFGNKKPIQTMFIPYALVKNSNTFYNSGELDDTLLFERFRIIECISEDIFFRNLNTSNIINECISFSIQ